MNNPYIVNIYSKYNTKGIFLWALTEFKYKRVFSLMAKGPPSSGRRGSKQKQMSHLPFSSFDLTV